MRAFSWVPLLGLLAALAAAQEEPVVDLEGVVPHHEEATHKTGGDPTPSGILQAVQDLVASAVSPAAAEPSPPAEGVQLDANPVPVEEDTVAEDVDPTDPSEAEETPTVLTNIDDEAVPAEPDTITDPNQVKLVGVYNEVVDNVLNVLSRSLANMGPMPIELTDDVALTALEASEPETETEPEPEPEPESNQQTRKGMKKKNKNKRNKNKNKNKKNKRKGEMSDDEEAERKTNKKNKKNKNKGVKKEEVEEEVEEEEVVQVESSKKGKNKRNKNKRKNKKNNKRKNKKNKKRSKVGDLEVARDGRAMSEDEEAEEETVAVEEGRRTAPVKTKANRKNKKNKKNKNKNKKNRKNKNKKNKNNNKKDKNTQEKESRADLGPVYPSDEERAASNAYLTGHSSVSRIGDVTVDDTGKAVLVNAKVQVGPLFVQLADAARALTKSQVSTLLEADMQFKIRTKGRGRQIIKLTSLAMSGPTEITVARLDLPLEPEVVLAAKDEVREALDVPRISRIFEKELENIFEKDNVVQNLEHHQLLEK